VLGEGAGAGGTARCTATAAGLEFLCHEDVLNEKLRARELWPSGSAARRTPALCTDGAHDKGKDDPIRPHGFLRDFIAECAAEQARFKPVCDQRSFSGLRAKSFPVLVVPTMGL
jgi:hypothetical protein